MPKENEKVNEKAPSEDPKQDLGEGTILRMKKWKRGKREGRIQERGAEIAITFKKIKMIL